MKTKGALVLPVDSTITEQRISHLSAYFHSETQLYSSYHAASYAVELLMSIQVQSASDRAFYKDTMRILGFPSLCSCGAVATGSGLA
jgi:hypothetical protein